MEQNGWKSIFQTQLLLGMTRRNDLALVGVESSFSDCSLLLFCHLFVIIVYSVQAMYLSTTAGSDLADKTRNILKKIMTDKMQMMFNYEGRGTKNNASLKKYPAILSVIYRT